LITKSRTTLLLICLFWQCYTLADLTALKSAVSQTTAKKIIFENRAQCAVSSELASSSAFMIVDSFSAGKLASNIASQTGENPKEFAEKLMKLFRIRLGEVVNKTNSQLSISSGVQLNCSYLTKISNSHFHLLTQDPNKADLTQIAKNYDQPLLDINCSSDLEDLNNRDFIFHLDSSDSQNTFWLVNGFSYWSQWKNLLTKNWSEDDYIDPNHELKVYEQQLKQIDISESIFLISDNCKSLVKPACDQDQISLNAIRELAKFEDASQQFTDENSKGPESDLLKRGARGVNSDILNFSQFESLPQWSENFRERYKKVQWLYKNKLLNSMQSLFLISRHPKFNQLTEIAKDELSTNDLSEEKLFLSEQAAFCFEWRLAGEKDLNFYFSDIELALKYFEANPKLFEGFDISFQSWQNWLLSLQNSIPALCQNLEKNNFFVTNLDKINWGVLNKWSYELMFNDKSNKPPMLKNPWANSNFLNTSPNDSLNLNSICQSALGCLREILKSFVDLRLVSQYAAPFIKLEDNLRTAHLLNPYSELKACEIYDPWYQTKRARTRLFFDLLNTAVTGWNNIPFFLDVDLKPGTVTSFNKLLEEGKIKLNPNIKKAHLSANFILELGSLTGAPCTIQYNQTSISTGLPNIYGFTGISLGYCSSREKNSSATDSSSGQNVTNNNSANSSCIACTLNFQALGSSASAITSGATFGINPVKLGFSIFRSIYRFAELRKDKLNIPRTHVVDPEYVNEVYTKASDIPDKCIDLLKTGKRCLRSICESHIATKLYEDYNLKLNKINFISTKKGAEVLNGYRTASIQLGKCHRLDFDVLCASSEKMETKILDPSFSSRINRCLN
jgi:hypothetical protein